MEWLSRLNREQRAAFEELIASDRVLEAMRFLRDDAGIDREVAEAYVSGRIDARANATSAAAASWIPTRAGALDASGAGARVDAFLRAGQKIGAIKAYREATGAGLTQAKSAVEAREAVLFPGMRPQRAANAAGNGGCVAVLLAALLIAILGVTAFVHMSQTAH